MSETAKANPYTSHHRGGLLDMLPGTQRLAWPEEEACGGKAKAVADAFFGCA